MKATFSTKGFAEYLEKIAQAGLDVDKAAANAVAAGGNVLLEGMQRRVPRLTGELAKALERTEPEQDGNYIFVEVGVSIDAEDEVARYGNVQEFGSAHTPAQPYIRPSIDEDRSKVFQAQKKSLEQDGLI